MEFVFFRLSNQRFVRSLSLTTAVNNGYGESSSLPPSPCICFFPPVKSRFVRSAYAPVRSLTASQRRRSIVAAKAHRFRLHPVFVFSRLSNQRFVRSLSLTTAVNNGCGGKLNVYPLHPVFVFLAPSLHKTFLVLFRFG